MAHDLEIYCGDPFIVYRETTTKASSKQCETVSNDKMSTIKMMAEPLTSDITNILEVNVSSLDKE